MILIEEFRLMNMITSHFGPSPALSAYSPSLSFSRYNDWTWAVQEIEFYFIIIN